MPDVDRACARPVGIGEEPRSPGDPTPPKKVDASREGTNPPPRAEYDETMEHLTAEELTPDPVTERAIGQMRRVRLRSQGLTDRQIDAAYGPEPGSD